jgi:MFS family permease
VLLDRSSRRDVLAGALLLSALSLGAVAALAARDVPFAVILVLAAVCTVAGAAHRPAHAAILPVLATTPRQLAACNAFWSGLDNFAFLAGSLLGGAIIALASLPAAFAAEAALMGVGFLVVLTIPRDEVPEHRAEEERMEGVEEALEGARHVLAHPELRLVVGLFTFATLIEGAIDVVVVAVALEHLGLQEQSVGWLNAAWGVGGLAGGLAALWLLARGRLAAGLTLGGLLVGLALAGLAGVDGAAAAAALLCAIGLGYALMEAATLSLLQRLSADVVLGRVFAVIESSYWLATGAGAILAPALVSLAGVEGSLVVLGAALVAAVALRFVPLARLEAGAVVPEREFRALRAQPVFAPLPIATVEGLSRQTGTRHAAPDEPVVVQGDVGEHFYVVDEGRLRVSVDGEEVAVCGPGESFGEIALLHAVPRTATVTADGAAVLFEVSRDAFLDALGVHRSAHRAAERQADGYLARAGSLEPSDP